MIASLLCLAICSTPAVAELRLIVAPGTAHNYMNDPVTFAQPYDLSDDGEVVVGQWSEKSGHTAFRWTWSKGGVSLTAPPKAGHVRATAVSGEGRTIAGADIRAFVWAEPGTPVAASYGGGLILVDQMGLAEEGIYVSAISSNGDVLAGYADKPNGHEAPFIWRLGQGHRLLRTQSGEPLNARLCSLSSDGTVAVGTLQPEALDQTGSRFTPERAFRWSISKGQQVLALTPGFQNSVAVAASADGSVIVGSMWGNNVPARTCVWRGPSPPRLIDTEASSFTPTAISQDGKIVAGMLHSKAIGKASIWKAGQGLRTLEALLPELRGDMPPFGFNMPTRLKIHKSIVTCIGYSADKGWVIKFPIGRL